MSLFRSFHHLIATNLDQRIIFDEKAITVFLPVDQAWKLLGLTETYLLSSEAGDSLSKILLNGILNGIHYSKDFSKHSKEYPTLGDHNAIIHSEGDILNFNGENVTMSEHDILSQNGVAHSLSQVIIPSNVVITPENLINATGSSIWLNLLKSYNLSEYLDLNANYTLLIPTDDAINTTEILSLAGNTFKDIVETHIIPPQNGHPKKLLGARSKVKQTLSGKNISIHEIYPDIWSVQIDNSTSARVLDQGRTSHGSQIVLIDRVLYSPYISRSTNWVWARPIGLFIVGVAVIVSVLAGGNYIVKKWRAGRTKPLFAGDAEETEPLFNGNGRAYSA
jgi:uncharacterized surface protein with fasciclin (FAS1) repeats